MDIKGWLQKIASSFQPAADQIHSWDLPPDLKAKVNEIWNNLPIVMQTAIWKFVKSIADKYGDQLAQEILNAVLDALAKV